MDDKIYISLRFLGLTKSVSSREGYIVLLRETEGKRCVPILVNKEQFEIISSVMTQGNSSEQLFQLASYYFGVDVDTVVIKGGDAGIYTAALTMVQDGVRKTVDVEITVGFIAAIKTGCPLLMEQEVFDKYVGKEIRPDVVSFPVFSLTDKMLEEALAAAVASDRFELAGVIRDEIKRRTNLRESKQGEPEKLNGNDAL